MIFGAEMNAKIKTIDGADWTIEDVLEVATGDRKVSLSNDPVYQEKIQAGADYVESLWRSGESIYGINTGYGASVERKVPF